MANLIDLDTYTDVRGNLTVIERIVPFDIKRIFYLYGVDSSKRGGHRHKKTIQAAICIQGECDILCNKGDGETVFHLNRPNQCLILNPEDWHSMFNFTNNAILMVVASEYYDPADYIFETY